VTFQVWLAGFLFPFGLEPGIVRPGDAVALLIIRWRFWPLLAWQLCCLISDGFGAGIAF
jgi:hypothetical protein